MVYEYLLFSKVFISAARNDDKAQIVAASIINGSHPRFRRSILLKAAAFHGVGQRATLTLDKLPCNCDP